MAESQTDSIEEAREAYFRELGRWLEETRQWHQQHLQQPHNGYVEYMRQDDSALRQRRVPQGVQQPQQAPQHTVGAVRGRVYKQYKVPSLWRRLVAEILDFLILLSLKLFLVIISFEIATTLHIQDYWSSPDQHKIALHLTVLELFQAFMSLFYETMFLSSTLSATPGKRYMGLQVLYVEDIVTPPPYLDGTIACFPATRLSVGRALMRSIVKHVLCAFMLPVFYSFLTLGFNRTRYDLYASTVVVEYDPDPALQVY